MDPRVRQQLASLPSVSAVLAHPSLDGVPHALAVEAARAAISSLRSRLLGGDKVDLEGVFKDSARRANLARKRRLRRVINATGVVLHTNLGRAALAPEVVEAVVEVARGYANVEMHLEGGQRGGRLEGVSDPMRRATGAEAAIAVNNNAAAVLLALTSLARGREVIVSRGELVEIGGSFRVPDVISAGGAKLVEVGTTNRTRASDFADAITDDTAVLLRVHPSNFRQVGFVQRPERADLVEVAAQYGVPLVEDLGSGLIGPPPVAGMGLDEERVELALQAGVDLVCFSGDKLLGGPQAGIIAGKAELVRKLRKHALYRALRLDKLGLVALEATLRMVAEGRAAELPTHRMLGASLDSLRAAAVDLSDRISGSTVEADHGVTGGGALPGRGLPTWVVVLPDSGCDRLLHALRMGTPAVVARVADNKVRLDPRTLLEGEASEVAEAIRAARLQCAPTG